MDPRESNLFQVYFSLVNISLDSCFNNLIKKKILKIIVCTVVIIVSDDDNEYKIREFGFH